MSFPAAQVTTAPGASAASPDRAAGVQLELAGLRRDWVEDAVPVVLAYARGVDSFTTDDLHGLLPAPEHPNWFGVLTAKLANQGLIERIGARPSRRPEANGRLLSVWRFVSGKELTC